MNSVLKALQNKLNNAHLEKRTPHGVVRSRRAETATHIEHGYQCHPVHVRARAVTDNDGAPRCIAVAVIFFDPFARCFIEVTFLNLCKTRSQAVATIADHRPTASTV